MSCRATSVVTGLPRLLTSGPGGAERPQKTASPAVDVEGHGPTADAKPSATPAGVAIFRWEALVSATATGGPTMARRRYRECSRARQALRELAPNRRGWPNVETDASASHST